ncbi:hypothetical protein [Streptomyces sp. NPDC093089]|uniref:hypothetical protein n=1 Tax=Streptomyces sp. NPDC093089 TaxID=3366024 RepID=UPI0037F99D91
MSGTGPAVGAVPSVVQPQSGPDAAFGAGPESTVWTPARRAKKGRSSAARPSVSRIRSAISGSIRARTEAHTPSSRTSSNSRISSRARPGSFAEERISSRARPGSFAEEVDASRFTASSRPGFSLRAVCRDADEKILADTPLPDGNLQRVGTLPEGVDQAALHSVEIAGTFTTRESGAHRFGAGGVGELTLTIAGRTLFEGTRAAATTSSTARTVSPAAPTAAFSRATSHAAWERSAMTHRVHCAKAAPEPSPVKRAMQPTGESQLLQQLTKRLGGARPGGRDHRPPRP